MPVIPSEVPSADQLVGSLTGMKVVLLNGPPRSGKDSGGQALLHSKFPFPERATAKISRHLKESVHADHGHPQLPYDHFEASKDEPSELLGGWIPRQAYIHKSEVVVKPVMGDDYYGRVLVHHVMKPAAEAGIKLIIVTDSGFFDEAMPIIGAVGSENVLHLRIRAEHRGVSFEGDSRSYMDLPPDVAAYNIWNVEYTHYCNKLQILVGLWLGISAPEFFS